MADRNRGIALVTALAILVIVSLLVVGIAFSTRIELLITRNDATSTQANYVAQAGLQTYKAELFQYYRWLEQTGVTQTNPSRTACFNRLSYGLQLNRDLAALEAGNVEYSWTNDKIGPFNADVMDAAGANIVGSYEVWLYRDPNNNDRYSIKSIGRAHGAISTARATFTIVNSGVLEQAIFSGTGQANKSINGGATIRGGVYAVGVDGTYVIGTNGDFTMYNNYDLASEYPGFEQYVTQGNRKADNLCATLRIDHGQLKLSGSTLLGEPDPNPLPSGSQSKHLLGVYVNGGTTDITDKTGLLNECQKNKGVCTDALGPFNLKPPPTFPTLNGSPDPQLCSLGTWRECIDTASQNQGLYAKYGAALSLPNVDTWNDKTSCENALSTETITFNDQIVDCTYTGLDNKTHGFIYDGLNASPPTLKVYGDVALSGYNVDFAKGAAYTAVSYGSGATQGNASFVVEEDPPCPLADEKKGTCSPSNGNMTVGANILPDASSGSASQFPNNVLGLIAEHNLDQTAKDTSVMAPVYAGNRYSIGGKNNLFGSVIADTFCTTTAGGNSCNAGQTAQVVYINTANNKPSLLKQISPKAGYPTFTVDTYEVR